MLYFAHLANKDLLISYCSLEDGSDNVRHVIVHAELVLLHLSTLVQTILTGSASLVFQKNISLLRLSLKVGSASNVTVSNKIASDVLALDCALNAKLDIS